MADERGRTFYHQGASTPPNTGQGSAAGGYQDPAADRFAKRAMDSMPNALGMIKAMQAPAIDTTMAGDSTQPQLTRGELREMYARTRSRAVEHLGQDAAFELDRLMQEFEA